MHYVAVVFKAVYDKVVLVPRWVLMLASGGIANVAMRYAHRNDPDPEAVKAEREAAAKIVAEKKAAEKAAAEANTQSTQASATGASPSKGKGKQRKHAKK